MSDQYFGRDLEALSCLVNYNRWIFDEFSAFVSGDVVEYGAGIGAFSKLFYPLSRTLTVVEPARNLIPALTGNLAGMAVTLVQDSVEGHTAIAGPGRFDTAILINVLEHIEDDEQALSGLHGILRPGGRLLIFVPALTWLMSDIDRLVGHVRRYHLAALEKKIVSAGFTLGKRRYFDMLGILPWFIVNRLGRATDFDSRMAKVYDRTAVPVGRAIESIVAPPLGKNILLVATRGSGQMVEST